MVVPERRAPFRRTPKFAKRNLLQLSITSALAASGILLTAPAADARTTKLDITSRTIAFGGYSFTGVGQFEKIVGIAHGELNPNDAKNAVITDILLAPRNASGNVEYAHNFYILNAVVQGARSRIVFVPRDLWCEAVGDRVNRAFAVGGASLLGLALAEHGLPVSGSVVLRRAATERLLASVCLTVSVPRSLEFVYPLMPTTLVQDGAKLVRFSPPAETLTGERLHQWLGARKVLEVRAPTSPGSGGSKWPFERHSGTVLSFREALADSALVRVSGNPLPHSPPCAATGSSRPSMTSSRG